MMAKRVSIRLWRKHHISIMATGLVTVTILIIAAPYFFVIVGPGKGGVFFNTFFGGTVTVEVYGEGLQTIAPWNQLFIYDLRIQEKTFPVDVLSLNGLTVWVDVSVRWRPRFRHLGFLHKVFGPNYVKKLVMPETTAAVRTVVGRYLPEELYSTLRSRIQQELLTQISAQMANYYIEIDQIILKSIKLPPMINEAIESKLEEEQISHGYHYLLEREVQEALRKKIEATGIRDYQHLIQATLKPSLVSWAGLHASLKLATSKNAKVMMISDSKGLPVIRSEGEK